MSPRKNVTYSSKPNHAARSAHAKGDKLFRTYDTTAIRPKRSPIPAIIGVIVLVAAIVGIIFFVMNFMKGCSQQNLLPEGQEVEVVVSEGEGPKSIAKTLVSKGIISDTATFTNRVAELGAENSMQPGVYTLRGGQSVDEIIKVLQTPVAAETFTVPEGSTLRQTAEIVQTATEGRIKADDFVAAAGNASSYAGDYAFLAEAGDGTLEGFLFPKTYPVNDDSTADSIIRTMLDQYATETGTLDWSYAEGRGLTHYEVLKLASIVEKESDESHRATVASVFYNRLANGMTLDSDATVAYEVGHDPTPDDVATVGDYNTYFVSALDIPTPINSPSLACLQAVCAPEETPYLYFYFEADSSGNMEYYVSQTSEEHMSTFQ